MCIRLEPALGPRLELTGDLLQLGIDADLPSTAPRGEARTRPRRQVPATAHHDSTCVASTVRIPALAAQFLCVPCRRYEPAHRRTTGSLSVAEVSGASYLCVPVWHGNVRSFDHRMKVRTMTSWAHPGSNPAGDLRSRQGF